MKKGDLSMGVIIGAAIALLILVLLSVLLFRAGGTVVEGTSCTSTDGAYCELLDIECEQGYTRNPGLTCPVEDEKCCIPFG